MIGARENGGRYFGALCGKVRPAVVQRFVWLSRVRSRVVRSCVELRVVFAFTFFGTSFVSKTINNNAKWVVIRFNSFPLQNKVHYRQENIHYDIMSRGVGYGFTKDRQRTSFT